MLLLSFTLVREQAESVTYVVSKWQQHHLNLDRLFQSLYQYFLYKN
jgi:hypothetical protein